MNVFPVKLDWKKQATNPLEIYVFADTHVGNSMARLDLLQKHITRCKEEEAYWIHLGDIIDAIGPKDKRFGFEDLDDLRQTYIQQYKEAKALFSPIKDKCLGILAGNHEMKLLSDGVGDFAGLLAADFETNYLGYMGYLYTQARPGKSLTLFCWHGHGGGELLGSKALRLQRLGAKFAGDIYLIGHWHTYLTHSDEFLKPIFQRTGKSLPYVFKQQRWYYAVPGYIDGYDKDVKVNYIKRAAYQPQRQGCIKLSITNHTEQETGRNPNVITYYRVKHELIDY